MDLEVWVWNCGFHTYSVWSVSQSCPTLGDPMDCSPPGSSVHGIFQARILEWDAILFCRGSSWPRDWTCIYPCLLHHRQFLNKVLSAKYFCSHSFTHVFTEALWTLYLLVMSIRGEKRMQCSSLGKLSGQRGWQEKHSKKRWTVVSATK